MDNKTLQETLFQGLDATHWGFGFKRIILEIPIQTQNGKPFTFTSVGFKSKEKDFYICLRMLGDPNSIKLRICVETTDVKEAWHSMLKEYFTKTNIKYSTTKNANNYRLI